MAEQFCPVSILCLGRAACARFAWRCSEDRPYSARCGSERRRRAMDGFCLCYGDQAAWSGGVFFAILPRLSVGRGRMCADFVCGTGYLPVARSGMDKLPGTNLFRTLLVS